MPEDIRLRKMNLFVFELLCLSEMYFGRAEFWN